MIGYVKITKREFYLNGGFANPKCIRVTRGKSYAHYWEE